MNTDKDKPEECKDCKHWGTDKCYVNNLVKIFKMEEE